MAPITTIGAVAGCAKQSAFGALAAQPTFAHGLKGGAPIKVDPKQATLEVTTGKRAASNLVRETVEASSEVQAPAYLRSLGLWLLGAIGAVTTTGVAAPYTHTFALGDLPYLSVFAKGIGADIEAIRDCKVDELTLKWEGAKPLEMTVKAMGTVFSYPAAFTPTTDETASEAFLVPVGGTFQYDPIGATMVSARVISGELTIKNNVKTQVASQSVETSIVQEGIQEHSLKLTIVPDDLADFRKTVTGAAAGTAAAQTVPVGSVALTFKENAGTGTLTVNGSKVAFLTSFPEADPKGGTVEIELAGMAVLATGATTPLIYVLSNAQASY